MRMQSVGCLLAACRASRMTCTRSCETVGSCETVPRVCVTTTRKTPNHSTTLGNTLHQLSEYDFASKTTIAISHMWNCDVRAIVISAKPHMPSFKWAVSLSTPLTDHALDNIMGHTQGLSVPSLKLKSGQHANTPWLWQKFAVTKRMDVAMLARLPKPASRMATIRCGQNIVLNGYEILKVRWLYAYGE